MIRRAFIRMVAGLVGAGLVSKGVAPNTPRELVLRGRVTRRELSRWLSVCFTRNNREGYGFAPGTMLMVQWTAAPINDHTFDLQCHLRPYTPIRVVDASGPLGEYHVYEIADWPSLQGFAEVRNAG